MNESKIGALSNRGAFVFAVIHFRGSFMDLDLTTYV
jgi:hypothetical protein